MNDYIKLSSPATHDYWEIPILYEDDHLLALDKPSRLLTSPDRYDAERPNLMKLLHRDIARGAGWVQQRQLVYLANAHRLDFETTGVLLLAKNKPALIALANQFGTEKLEKNYLALVQGQPLENTFEVSAKLAPHPYKTGLMRVDSKKGKAARTAFTVHASFAGFALLDCRPWTGRTHQIRVHLKHFGLPIVGDHLYGGRPLLLSRLKPKYRAKEDEPERPLIGRCALHAEKLAIIHPVAGHRVVITSPWPKDFTVAVKYLRRYAA